MVKRHDGRVLLRKFQQHSRKARKFLTYQHAILYYKACVGRHFPAQTIAQSLIWKGPKWDRALRSLVELRMSATTAAQTELIRLVDSKALDWALRTDLQSSLSQDEIPIKLRCAICSRLAVNAFRLPCCEQAICESLCKYFAAAFSFFQSLLQILIH